MKLNLLFCFLIFTSCSGKSPIVGDKQITTKSLNISGVNSVKINLYAKVTIDASMEDKLTMEVDANLLDHIKLSFDNGKLEIDQENWIQPSKPIIIHIGAQGLQEVIQSTHEEMKIINLDTKEILVKAEVGRIRLEGTATKLISDIRLGTVEATRLQVEEIEVDMNGWGELHVDDPSQIYGTIKGGASLVYKTKPSVSNLDISDNSSVVSFDDRTINKDETRYISLQIKNDSWKRINAYVIGPKPEGGKFSYGFPMRPGQTRSERWTIGSKIYRVSTLGTKKLLTTITANDEGKTIHLSPTDKTK